MATGALLGRGRLGSHLVLSTQGEHGEVGPLSRVEAGPHNRKLQGTYAPICVSSADSKDLTRLYPHIRTCFSTQVGHTFTTKTDHKAENHAAIEPRLSKVRIREQTARFLAMSVRVYIPCTFKTPLQMFSRSARII